MKTSSTLFGSMVIAMVAVLPCRANQVGGTGGGLDCGGTTITSTSVKDGVEIESETTYVGGCKATVKYVYAADGSPYQPDQTWDVHDNCGCPPFPSVGVTNGMWLYDSTTLQNITPDTSTFVAATPIDHMTIYDLTSGNAIFTSGTLGTNLSLTVSNSLFTPGTPYATTSCTSDNLIQGAVCFLGGAPIQALRQFEGWQNDSTNVPGATVIAIDANNHYSSLAQFTGGVISVGSGTITNAPAVSIAKSGNQLVLYWPATATNYFLQTTTNLEPANWVPVADGEPIIGVTLSNAASSSFYRLQKLP